MSHLTPLQMLILSDLYGRSAPITRYEAMANLNRITTAIEQPYSPGAIYHCIKGLSQAKMIDFDHKSISISPLGQENLTSYLTQSPPPASILIAIYEALAIQGIADPEIRKQATQRLRINMIKNNQYTDGNLPPRQNQGRVDRALIFCHQELNKALSRIILEVGD